MGARGYSSGAHNHKQGPNPESTVRLRCLISHFKHCTTQSNTTQTKYVSHVKTMQICFVEITTHNFVNSVRRRSSKDSHWSDIWRRRCEHWSCHCYSHWSVVVYAGADPEIWADGVACSGVYSDKKLLYISVIECIFLKYDSKLIENKSD